MNDLTPEQREACELQLRDEKMKEKGYNRRVDLVDSAPLYIKSATMYKHILNSFGTFGIKRIVKI